MELHYKGPRINPPPDPWDESFPGCFPPPTAFLEPDGNFTYRLIPELRQAAQTMDPIQILARAAEAFFFSQNSAETALDAEAALARGNAFADLAVTGRMAYDAFKRGVDLRALKTATTALLTTGFVPDELSRQIDAAMDLALDRAYNVAWALRGPPAQRAALRATLGWIAVSGEDDKPHRPVNVPAPPYEQSETVVTTQGQRLATRFFVASAVEPPPRVLPQRAREVPPEVPLNVPDEHDVILFLHGHSSGADEALAIIPDLLAAGLERGIKYSVLAFDLPNNGYSQSFNHLGFSPLTETTYPKDPADQKHIAAPILDFLENFIVAFVDSLPPYIRSRIVAVIGGSLGGNLSLRLGRRDLSGKSWSIPAIVSWSPASVWPPKVAHVIDYQLPNTCFDRCGEAEETGTRDSYFFQAYEETNLLGVVRPQSEYWYRDNYALKPFYVGQSRFGRYEVYDSNFRQMHWRVAGEQLIYSHVDNEIFHDHSTPIRCTKNTVRTLLVAGGHDNTIGTHIYDNTIKMSELMTAPGRRLLLNTTGHSIHFERPRYFASEIVKFLNATTRFIVCVTKKNDKIVSYGVKTDPTDATAPVQMTFDECVEAIRQGHDFYAVSADGQQSYVRISHLEPVPTLGDPGGRSRGYYLRTISDDDTVDNIGFLPKCSA